MAFSSSITPFVNEQAHPSSMELNSWQHLSHPLQTLINQPTHGIYQPTQLIIFDANVDHLDHLLAGLTPGTQSHVLSPDRNGVDQISELLHQYPTASLTLVAHGFPGGVKLGNNTLELNNLDQYGDVLKTWFQHPVAAHLTLLSCHVAAGDAGEEFVTKLATLTGAEISASTRAIGNGQWPTAATQIFSANTLNHRSLCLTMIS